MWNIFSYVWNISIWKVDDAIYNYALSDSSKTHSFVALFITSDKMLYLNAIFTSLLTQKPTAITELKPVNSIYHFTDIN